MVLIVHTIKLGKKCEALLKKKTNILRLFKIGWLCNQNKDIDQVVTLKNAPNNLKVIAPDIKKDTVNCIST